MMRSFKLFLALVVFAALSMVSSRGQQLQTTGDPYLAWATQQWGVAVVNDPSQKATVWGPSADPDHDGLTNLQEYAFGTDPNHADASPVAKDFGKANPGYLTLNYTQRVGDAALVIFPQYSSDLQNWWPTPPLDAFSWQGDSTYFWNTTNGPVGSNGMQMVTRICAEPLSDSPAAFSRVLVMRSGTVAIGSPLDGVNFFDAVSGQSGSSVDSNSVVLSGFAGAVAMSVSGGAHLIVNGVDVGASASVTAGSTVRIRATSPANEASASYTLTIGGTVIRTWNVASRAPIAPSMTPPGGTSAVASSARVNQTTTGTPAAASPGISSTSSGYTPVSASVGEGGGSNISIPITVAPGTGGMEPKLAISYSSQGGNGLLGMGFGISGLSAITRTGPVQYLDGIKGGVAFSTNDRFTVDGQRLVLYSGTWGGDGTEYRTEQESFAKINSQGTTTAGPLSWTMRTKAGLIYEYGTSPDSRILANRSSVTGDTAVLMWALTRITDNVGNSIEFTYATPDGTESGIPRIASIAYTKNSNLTPGELVVFTYAARPDVRTSYVAGAKVVMSKRLTAIDCEQGGNIARHYDFTYQQAEISGNSQLVSVTEKGKKPTNIGDTWQTFPATTFTWDQKPAANMSLVTPTQSASLLQLGFSKSPPSLTVQGDFAGSGRLGIMNFNRLYSP